MQLIVAEKPSVARDLARVLGVRPVGEHAFESPQRTITWCIGHLVELDEPASYDTRWKAWRLDTLPMLPGTFRLRATKHAGAQRQAVARLLRDRRFTSVINACDAGREGELIFRYIYDYARSALPVQRLWISSLTDEAIRRGFAALAPGARFEPLADAARSRSEADWLVGMNATRAVTVHARAGGGPGTLWSIGRVQTPTLAMLVAREHAIQRFVPQPYWEVRGDFPFVAWWRAGKQSRLGAAALAEAVVARDTGQPAIVEQVRARTVREPPPLLFDLTSLQRTANRRFGLRAERTLAIAQALYERHKLLTYPRTDARHLTSDLVPELPGLFRGLAAVPEYAPFADALLAAPVRPTRRIVDDSKVHDHHAIIPTGKAPRSLDRDEQRIFDLVARRFLGAFYPDAEFAVTDAWLRVGAPSGPPPPFSDADETILDALPAPPDRYLARGRVRTVAGWQEVAGIDEDQKAEILPPLVEGQQLDGTYTAVAKHTKPPPRFTEATLLGAMESAGKQIDDEALRLAMKDCGLGTPATRASIIETLLERRYIERDKQHLVPTPTGIALIDALPVASLASPELTGSWEARLARIARGEDTRHAFMSDIARFVAEIVGAIRGAPAPTPPPAPPVGGCPRCGSPVAERARDYGCACGFALPKRLAGRMISPELAGVLLGKRRTQPLRGFRSKAGKKFSAALVLDTSGALVFEFGGKPASRPDAQSHAGPPPRAAVAEPLGCPRCKAGTLIAGSRGWGCSRWRDGCKLVIWFEAGGRRITAKELRDLVTRGKTRKARFASGAGRLVLDPAVDGGAASFSPA